MPENTSKLSRILVICLSFLMIVTVSGPVLASDDGDSSNPAGETHNTSAATEGQANQSANGTSSGGGDPDLDEVDPDPLTGDPAKRLFLIFIIVLPL